ncbi:MAG: type IX secretion system sortase PorU [Dysgonamonadaceae bacterium]|jgi:hypothetical protein|nr:type IX secretion system sortase PorU [Dysgonamonadaceae bacterium]
MILKTNRLVLVLLLAFAANISVSARNDSDRYAVSSVLSEGKWVKMKITETGVYKLTYEDIKKQGITPEKVKIYGYGGAILDEDFSKPYIDDLPEVSVYINKGSDGVFGAGDYLLFYGQGVIKWDYNANSGSFEHKNNPYSTETYYFMTESEGGAKEMSTNNGLSSASKSVSVFDDYLLYEKDLYTIASTGKELFGENFATQSTYTFQFSIPGITSDAGTVRLYFAGAPKTLTPVTLSIDNKELINQNVRAPSDTYCKATTVDKTSAWTGEKKESFSVSVTFNPAERALAHLNFIEFNVKRELKVYDSYQTFFRNSESLVRSLKYEIDNASSETLILDVTDNYASQLIKTELSGSKLSFCAESDNNVVREYAMIDLKKTIPSPTFEGKIENQDLHALPQADMIIISPKPFVSQAEKLAAKHRAEGLSAVVVSDRLIFNEFSSGTPDATAYRRFVKMFYDRAESDSEKPRYLLLFGDGIFDNRHLTAAAARLDPQYYLLSYQVDESANEVISYGTDDYFGFLDDEEGAIFGRGTLDIGIGRFPISSVSQAENAVNKVISYMNDTRRGMWKNRLVFTADNTDSYQYGDNFCKHATQADSLARYMERTYPEYTLYKYYMDAYKSVSVNGKVSYPDAKKSFLNTLNEGVFLVNYTGHGSTTAWSGEDMLQITDVRQMTFEDLPLWITATCDFGWYDRLEVSAGEEAFLNTKSGAIALFTTSRVVSSDNNYYINDQIIRYLFKKDSEGKRLRLGDVLRESKNKLPNDMNKLNYVLLGDPALRLNYPDGGIKLETINGENVSDDRTFNFKALDRITITGSVTDFNGQQNNQFSGVLNISVSDSKQTIESVTASENNNHFYYSTYPNVIYTGTCAVENGKFKFSFTVPLDISYTKSSGLMNFYASDPTANSDAYGSFQNYVLSGSNDNTSDDELGPEIENMYLNTTSFVDGDKVNETPFFVAYVFDEDGINRSGSGLGHDISLNIDGINSKTYNLNNYYEFIDETSGYVGFSIPTLSAGKHKLYFRIWDVKNNSTLDSLNFEVMEGFKPQLFNIDARENPARTNTYFILEHNLPETQLEVDLRVFDLMGRLVWSHIERGSSGYLSYYPIEWNLQNNAGNRVATGIYVYRASIRTSTSVEVTKGKKIIVLAQ